MRDAKAMGWSLSMAKTNPPVDGENIPLIAYLIIFRCNLFTFHQLIMYEIY